MAQGSDLEVKSSADILDRAYHGRHFASRNRGVYFEHGGGPDSRQGRKGRAARLPNLVALGAVQGNLNPHHTHLFADGLDPCGFLLHLGGMTVHFDQEKRRGIHGEPRAAEILDRPDGEIVHEFERNRNDPVGNNCRDRLGGRGDIG